MTEEYKLIDRREHKLTILAKAIDKNLYKKLNIEKYENTLERYDDFFFNSRYYYEKDVHRGYDDMIITAGIGIFREVIVWYKETNSSDPWIINYPEIPGGELK